MRPKVERQAGRHAPKFLQIVPREVASSAAGVINGIANIVGSSAPLGMGLMIQATRNFDSGMMALVSATLFRSLFILLLTGNFDGG